MSKRKLPNVIEKAHGGNYTGRVSCPRTHHEEPDPRKTARVTTLFVRNGYRAELCDHGTHPPDHCWTCAPMWGVKAVQVST